MEMRAPVMFLDFSLTVTTLYMSYMWMRDLSNEGGINS